PFSRCLYGRRVRQPIGGDFGFSGDLRLKFIEARDLTIDSLRDKELFLDELIKKGEKARQNMLNKTNFSHNDYECDLKELKLSKLLYYNFNSNKFKRITEFTKKDKYNE
ncbi:MAG: hypothetical protein ACFFAO_17970, partial [Candidatus Hermodarchaeota archaeon]